MTEQTDQSLLDPRRVGRFLSLLADSGFKGDIGGDFANRLVSATDNSVYQVMPAAVLFPRVPEDLNLIVALASNSPVSPIPLTARGGGTGTNGQSLTGGVVVDTSRYLNRVLHFDAEALRVVVEPGVVLGQLNAFLQPHGLFFSPTVATASRATIGGMVATDASGKGSRLYGKTSDYIEAMDVVLADGSDFRVAAKSIQDVEAMAGQGGLAASGQLQVLRTVTSFQEEIDHVFPDMNRGLTGYNLKMAFDPDKGLMLHRVLAGSEGTLGITKSVELRICRKPKNRVLVVVRYDSFEGALNDVGRVLDANPAAVETLDEKILALAQQDVMWAGIERVLGKETARPVKGINFIELVADDQAVIDSGIEILDRMFSNAPPSAVIDWKVVTQSGAIDQLWGLREKSVGLLGNLPGRRQGAAFVEDTAVPPHRLPEFVREFRAILDGHGLNYGMFGHADVGCLHVRPALDMSDPVDAALLRPISDEVAALAKRYGGLLWGEHGRGYRGEYSPFFFGPTLYAELCKIKAAFDPQNIFNPGKLVSAPGGAPVVAIDEPPLRGEFDRQVTPENRMGFDRALACNGNGVCFSWDAADTMCPSYKATRDRVQSPKGRATLLREWTRRKSLAGSGSSHRAVENAVHDSLSSCLSCKACANQCPIQVDIPAMKSRFLDTYYSTRRRPLRHHIVAAMEKLMPLAMRWPWAANIVTQSWPMRVLFASLGLVDLPIFRPNSPRHRDLDIASLAALPVEEKKRHVIFIPDSFTAAFDGDAPAAVQECLTRLGYRVHVAPLYPNGKPLHVLGLLGRFERIARSSRARHRAFLATGVSVIGIESVTVLMDRFEYRETANSQDDCVIKTIDEFLAQEVLDGRIAPVQCRTQPAFHLFLHCTEKTAMPATGARWQSIFAAFGAKLVVERTGCCGMAGLFGHEREHAAMSKDLFSMSWRQLVEGLGASQVLATGFSCRCQVKRLSHKRVRHPIQALLDAIGEKA